MILDGVSPQDDATVKCWGQNEGGHLGLGNTLHRGDDANGPCPPISTRVQVSGFRVQGSGFRVQGSGFTASPCVR